MEQPALLFNKKLKYSKINSSDFDNEDYADFKLVHQLKTENSPKAYKRKFRLKRNHVIIFLTIMIFAFAFVYFILTTTVDVPSIISKIKVSKELYYKMTMIQKKFYLNRIYGINSTTPKALRQRIEKFIVRQLKTELNKYKMADNNLLLKVGEKIQDAIYKLQHPKNCSEARIIVCLLDDFCSFGFSMHHISYCISIASGSGRTLIFQDGKRWTYNATWSEIFNPISNCSYDKHVVPFQSDSAYYTGPDQTNRIVFLRSRDERYLLNKTELLHIPEAAPKSLESFLLKHHSNPHVWFQGQLLKYVWKLNENIENAVNQNYAKIPFECGPVVGINFRRSDKYVNSNFFNLDEYMKWVDLWFDVMIDYNHTSNKHSKYCTNKRILYIATDEPKTLVNEANKKWGNRYRIYHSNLDKLEGRDYYTKKKRTKDYLIELNSEILILSKCQFVLCTFSNNICRLVYEIMQTYGTDASNNVHSLDYFYSEHSHNIRMVAITDYIQEKDGSEEIQLKEGDIIEVTSPIDNEGYVLGRKSLVDLLQGQTKIPIYLLKYHSNFVNFTTFMNIELK
ncbi:hypothetical protein ACQ4LE_000709 [Meloidogyne hapla]